MRIQLLKYIFDLSVAEKQLDLVIRPKYDPPQITKLKKALDEFILIGMIIEKRTVGERGQIVLPKELREQFNL